VTSPWRSVAVALVLLGSLSSAVTARADGPADAKARYDKGVAAYTAHDYEAAVTWFKDAYALDPRPEILFAWAQAERLSGDCTSAIALYRKFLDGHPADVQADAAQAPLEKCERSLAAPVEAPGAIVPATPAAPPPTPAPAPTRSPARPPFYHDTLADVFVGAGVVAAAVGVGLLVTADSPDGATTYADFQSRHDSAVSRTRAGGIAVAVGAALIAGGVTHWMIWGGPGDAGIAAAGTF
jgi:tetratricopeptide (TPR) repeat protein